MVGLVLTGAAGRVSRPRGGGAHAVLVRNVVSFRRQWVALVTGFFEPVFYLLSLGVGLGALVGPVPVGGGREVTYAQFVAPALLASAAMNGAIYDATFNLFFKLRYAKTFDAMLSTPITPRDIAVGETLWCLARGLVYVVGFLVVALSLGLVESWWAVLAVPAATLIGFTFAAVGMAATTWIRAISDFDYVQLAIVPMFLLSATFYPLSTYPSGLRWLVQLSPLYHGVALERHLLIGDLKWSMLGHVAFLLALGSVGLWLVRRRLAALLLT